MQQTLVDMLRHGEPVGGRKYRGHIDDPLSEKGWQQMRNAVAEKCPWDLIVSSPLSRCISFAKEQVARHKIPLVVDDRFMEIAFGEWEGKTADEISQNDPDAVMNFYRDPEKYRPQDAEILSDFQSRVINAWNELIKEYTDKHILLITHAGVMRMVLRQILNMPLESMYRIQVPNAGITRIQIDGKGETAFSRLMFHAGTL